LERRVSAVLMTSVGSGQSTGTNGQASNWTEHTHSDGRKYYYNKITKQSTWVKPDCLKAAEESEEERDDDKEEKPEWNSQEERRNAFRELLEEKNVKCTMKWEEALKLIQDDRRFNALSTAGERKQVFAEFVTQTKKREKEEEREKRKRAKDEFIAALHDWKDLKVSTRYKEAAENFVEKDFFKLIDEEERDELFQDFMDEFEKNSKEERRKKRKEYVEKIKKLYDEHSEITVCSRYRDVQDLLRENETFRWLSKLEALTSWEEWVNDREKKEVEMQSKAKFRHERKGRDAFRDLMKEHYEQGKLTSTIGWRDYAKLVNEDEKYIALINLSGSTSHDFLKTSLRISENGTKKIGQR